MYREIPENRCTKYMHICIHIGSVIQKIKIKRQRQKCILIYKSENFLIQVRKLNLDVFKSFCDPNTQ